MQGGVIFWIIFNFNYVGLTLLNIKIDLLCHFIIHVPNIVFVHIVLTPINLQLKIPKK